MKKPILLCLKVPPPPPPNFFAYGLCLQITQGPMGHTWDLLLSILVCVLVSGSQRTLPFFVLEGLLVLSLLSYSQGW